MSIEIPKPAEVNTETSADYRNAALKLFEAEGAESTEAPPEPTAETPAPAEAAPVVPPVEAPKDAPLDRSFKALAEQQAMLRKEKDAFKERAAKVERYEKADGAKDVFEKLQAIGVSWKQIADRVSQGDLPIEPDTKPAPTAPAAANDIAELRAEVAQIKAEKARLIISKEAETVLSSAKFELVREMAGAEAVIAELTNYFNRTNELPGESMAESLEIIAQTMHERLETDAKRWEAVLSKRSKPAIKQSEPAPESISSASRTGGNTITNRDASAPRSPDSTNTPKTPEEYRLAALKLLMADPG